MENRFLGKGRARHGFFFKSGEGKVSKWKLLIGLVSVGGSDDELVMNFVLGG